MSDKVNDEDLKDGLTQAKKKPRNYVLIAKGSTAVKLIVQKKPIKAGDIQKAKTEAKGTLVVEGVCVGDGPEMVFQVLGEEPSIKVLTIKDYIGEETGMTLKSRFQVVTEFARVVEDDENAPGAPGPSSVSQAPEVSPQPGSEPSRVQPTETAPSSRDEDLLMILLSEMTKLGGRIKDAVKKAPERRNEIVGAVTAFQELLKAKNAADAKASFVGVKRLIDELLGPPQGPTAPSALENPEAAQWLKEWSALEPKYLAALKTAPADLAGKLRVVQAYASEQAEAGQFAKATAALARLYPLIEAAARGKGPASDVAEATVEKRIYMIERIQKLPKELRPSIDQLKAEIARQVPDEDPDELAGEIDFALQTLFDEMQNEIDAAINQGDMTVLKGMKDRVVAHPLVAHLVANPLTSGSSFSTLIIKALDEVEAKLAG